MSNNIHPNNVISMLNVVWKFTVIQKGNGVCKTVLFGTTTSCNWDTLNIRIYFVCILYIFTTLLAIFMTPLGCWLNIDTHHLSLRQEIMSVYKMSWMELVEEKINKSQVKKHKLLSVKVRFKYNLFKAWMESSYHNKDSPFRNYMLLEYLCAIF